jgi:hypothetical protein
MTRRKLSYPLEKVTLKLRKGDFDRLAALHGPQGVSEAIRKLIFKHLSKVDHRSNQIPLAKTKYIEEDMV